MQALAQTPVDRAALETARAEHLQLADQASKRFVQLIADVGDVLTPHATQGIDRPHRANAWDDAAFLIGLW